MRPLTSCVCGARAVANNQPCHHMMLCGIDKAWMVEHYFFMGMVGETGEHILLERVVDVLPQCEEVRYS